MSRLAKIFIFIAVVLALLGLSYFVWKVFFKVGGGVGEVIKEPNGNLPTANKNGNTSTTNENSPAKFKKISDNAVFGFWTVPETKAVYYLSPNGLIYEATDGPDVKISDQTINAPNSLTISPEKKKALVSFNDPKNPNWAIFDLIDKAWRPLPEEVKGAAWGASEKELFGIVTVSGKPTLSKIDITKTPPSYKTLIKDFRLKDVSLVFVSKNKLLIVEKPSYFYQSGVWQFDPEKLFFNLLLTPARGSWFAASENKTMFFQFDGSNELKFFNDNLNPIRLVEASIYSFPIKCDSFLKTAYCFKPREVDSNAVLPDDYIQKKFYTIDNLVSINTETEETKELLVSDNNEVPPIDGWQPRILENKVYFINRYDNSLYGLELIKN